MKRTILALVALGAIPTGILAQPAKEAKQATELPCKLTDYRIVRSSGPVAPDTVAVLCDGTRLADLAATGALYKLLDESVVYPAVESVKVQGPAARSGYWLVFRFTNGLQSGQDYELRLAGTYARPSNPEVAERFPATRFRFSTRPDLAVAKTPGRAGAYLTSHFEMQVSGAAKLIDQSNHREYGLQPASAEPNDYDSVGQVEILNGPSSPGQLGPKLAVQGVTDAFGQIPPVKPPKPAPPPAAPKSKDAATWYFNFLHQAGVGITPTWIANIKMAPVFSALPGGFFVTPALNVDVGQGQVGPAKTNDLINPKLGLTRFVRTRDRTLEAMQFAPSFSYETNRAFNKRNTLFDGDWRFYIRGLRNTKADRTQEAFLRKRRLDPKVLPQDVPKARFGYDNQILLGTELGGSVTANTAKSSDKSSQVVVPAYSIARLRPRLSSTWEFGGLTVSVSVYLRYLFSAENVTRETQTTKPGGKTSETIFLKTASGWRPYGECSVSYAFDPAGHYAVNTVYKLGSQPPNFDHVNLVQSGILIRF